MATTTIFEGASHVAYFAAGRQWLSYGYHKIIKTGSMFTVEYYYGSSVARHAEKGITSLSFKPDF
jgi:hypothetical protein